MVQGYYVSTKVMGGGFPRESVEILRASEGPTLGMTTLRCCFWGLCLCMNREENTRLPDRVGLGQAEGGPQGVARNGQS
jgi:hypothetical protein